MMLQMIHTRHLLHHYFHHWDSHALWRGVGGRRDRLSPGGKAGGLFISTCHCVEINLDQPNVANGIDEANFKNYESILRESRA